MTRSLALFPIAATAFVLLALTPCASGAGAAGLDLDDLAVLRTVGEVRISPDGGTVAYALAVPRTIPDDEDGRPWSELHVVAAGGGADRPFVSGKVTVSKIRFTPDGNAITYLAERGDDEHPSLWAIPLDGGESVRIVAFDEEIHDYRVSPAGDRIAFLADEPETEERRRARERGYDQEVFEEDWRQRGLWIVAFPPLTSQPVGPDRSVPEKPEPKRFEVEGAIRGVEWSPDGTLLALAVAPRPLIDDWYMKRRIRIHAAGDGTRVGGVDNPGKLGRFAFSPDSRHLALISAADPNDPSPGRLQVAPARGGTARDLLPELEADVRTFAWQDDGTIVALIDSGVETTIARVPLNGGPASTLLVSGLRPGARRRDPVVLDLDLSRDGRRAALRAESPLHPPEAYSVPLDGTAPLRLSSSNPWLADVDLADQESVSWSARDGLGLEGVLVRPAGSPGDGPAPLIVIVHGGPEGHVRNGWVTTYSRPGQVAAAKGYAAFYPNYRGSTGRGVAFSKLGQTDAAGPEFDDLIDGIDHLIATGIADPKRIGMTGGSYGGYATAWCATRYTERIRAGVMFVGISNKLSKGLTTDIPVEDEAVHTRFSPWTRWQYSLERSPLFYAANSRTALLIAGGTDDTRVHPSQSMQLYRAMKLAGAGPVRYVRYPGEEHGNRRAAARDDYARRLLRWMDHFLIDGGTAPPPWNLGLGEEPEEGEE